MLTSHRLLLWMLQTMRGGQRRRVHILYKGNEMEEWMQSAGIWLVSVLHANSQYFAKHTKHSKMPLADGACLLCSFSFSMASLVLPLSPPSTTSLIHSTCSTILHKCKCQVWITKRIQLVPPTMLVHICSKNSWSLLQLLNSIAYLIKRRKLPSITWWTKKETVSE